MIEATFGGLNDLQKRIILNLKCLLKRMSIRSSIKSLNNSYLEVMELNLEVLNDHPNELFWT